MGILYKAMIKEILEEIKREKPQDLEHFLKFKESKYKEKYSLPESLYFLNIQSVLAKSNKKSEHFDKKLKEALKNDIS